MLNTSKIITIIGCLMAIANAWATIDWDHFSFTPNNCMKLSLSAMMAMGAYFTDLKPRKNKKP
jgi:hypothetical protein